MRTSCRNCSRLRYTSGTETLFDGIYKLLPGHRLIFENDHARTEQYWDVPLDGPDPDLQRLDERELVDRFRGLLQESVRLRLMADVPLGAFLSGGIDSTAVAALMAREMDRPVETFSVAFADRGFSELEYARQAARAIGATSHEVVIDDDDFFGALPRLVWHEDEPIAHPSSVPLHFVSALARQHVKVVLTGEGSDELLAGYGKYPRALVNWNAGRVYERLVPSVVRSAVASGVSRGCRARREESRADRFSQCAATLRTCSSTTSPGFLCALNTRSSILTSSTAIRTTLRSRTSTGRMARQDCSIACCTRTSRRISSNC